MQNRPLQDYFLAASQLTARPLTFLWADRLPLGKLAIVDGDPGLGKSLVTLDLCARLSTGRPFPDGALPDGVASSIILNAEDSARGIIVQHLKALGADLDRVFVLNLDDSDQVLRFPDGIRVLEQIIAQTHAKLVIIDPIVAFLDAAVQITSDISVRHALLPLARLAERYQCVILLIRHLNKSGHQHSIYRGGGSIGFLAACRTAWLIAPDPERPACRIVAQIKNNVAPPQPSLAYEIVAADNRTPTLNWQSGTRPFTADQLLSNLGVGPAFSGPLARACDFLTSFLDEGPRTTTDVWSAAERVHLSERTLNRAKQKLEIRSHRVRIHGNSVSFWALKHQQPPNPDPSEAPIPDLEQWLTPLRKRFPPSNPLDDL